MLTTYKEQYEQVLKETGQGRTNPRILIIDDNVEFLEELQIMLCHNDYLINTVCDSGVAFDAAHVLKPELILMDLKMEPKNGFQVAEEIHHSFSLKKVPIIAMTGFFTEKEHVLMMKLCGIKTFILKPFKPNNLIAKIEFILGHRGEEYDLDQ